MRRLLSFLLLVAACRNAEQFRTPMTLGGKEVSAETMNLGHRAYVRNCLTCHGEKGDGLGPQAQGMSPPPTDLRRGLYKFASVEAGGLPLDTDLQRTVRKGLAGTPMQATTLTPEETNAVVQYIKTFSPRWQQEAAALAVRPDPVYASAANRAKVRSNDEWVAMGARVYHIDAQCWSCHPAYETKENLYEWSGRKISTFRADLYESKPTMNAFGVRTLAPDFTKDTLKTGASDEALHRVIAGGIGGSGMGSTVHTLEDEQIWSLVAYVRSLVDLKSHNRVQELRSRLDAQLDWQPGQ